MPGAAPSKQRRRPASPYCAPPHKKSCFSCAHALPCSTLSETIQEVPLLWAAEELAQPLAERLRHHFASERPPGPAGCRASRRSAARRACMPSCSPFSPIFIFRNNSSHPSFPSWVSLHPVAVQAGCPPTGPTGQSGCLPRRSRRRSSAARWLRSCSPAWVSRPVFSRGKRFRQLTS